MLLIDRQCWNAPRDKLVQCTVVEALNAIYETDFLGFSYGSGRSAVLTSHWMRYKFERIRPRSPIQSNGRFVT